jgi:hypothetical protein
MQHTTQVVNLAIDLPLAQGTVAAQGNTAGAEATQRHRNRPQVFASPYGAAPARVGCVGFGHVQRA